MTGKLDGRLGYTTTVKDQVDSIEVLLAIFRITWNILRESYKHKGNSRENYNFRLKSYKKILKLHSKNFISR